MRSRVSYFVKHDYNDTRHLAGINALAIEPTATCTSQIDSLAPDEHASGTGVLFTGGRDCIVNSWDLNIDFARLREEAEQREMNLHSTRRSSVSSKGPRGATPSLTTRKASMPSEHYGMPYRAPNSLAHSGGVDSEPVSPGGPSSSWDQAYVAAARRYSSAASNPSVMSPDVGSTLSLSKWTTGSPPAIDEGNNLLGSEVSGRLKTEAGILRKTRSVTFAGGAMSGVPMRNQRSQSIADADFTAPVQVPRWSTRMPPTTFSRSFQGHSDWVNDIVLCNQNLISASSDRRLYLWNTAQQNSYVRLGQHSDYVKCLAYAPGPGWVASGGLDRRIILWDVREQRGNISQLAGALPYGLPNDSVPEASIYSLACNPSGSAIVSGSPEKVVKVWDPRSGKKELRLTGHTDNIRSLLISDDGRWVISASSDTTIKLWSLAQPQRCVVTYTHSQDAIWCLYSNHPDLETFWSGSRDGWVLKMTRRRIGGDVIRGSRSLVNHEELVDCVAICKEETSVNKLVAIDDMYIWTATNSSTVNRWRDIPFRHATVVSSMENAPDDSDAIVIPAASIIHQPKPILDDERSLRSYHFSLASMDGPSLPLGTASLNRTSVINDWDDDEPVIEAVWRHPDFSVVGAPSVVKYFLLNDRRRVVTEDSDGRVELWDIVRCLKLRTYSSDPELSTSTTTKVSSDENVKKSLFDKVIEEENSFEWVANWCSLDAKNGFVTVHLDESKVYDAEIYHEDTGCHVKPILEDQRINVGRWVLNYLFICYSHAIRQRVPAAALLDCDYYLGAPIYTSLAAPPEEDLLYTYGQENRRVIPALQILDTSTLDDQTNRVTVLPDSDGHSGGVEGGDGLKPPGSLSICDNTGKNTLRSIHVDVADGVAIAGNSDVNDSADNAIVKTEDVPGIASVNLSSESEGRDSIDSSASEESMSSRDEGSKAVLAPSLPYLSQSIPLRESAQPIINFPPPPSTPPPPSALLLANGSDLSVPNSPDHRSATADLMIGSPSTKLPLSDGQGSTNSLMKKIRNTVRRRTSSKEQNYDDASNSGNGTNSSNNSGVSTVKSSPALKKKASAGRLGKLPWGKDKSPLLNSQSPPVRSHQRNLSEGSIPLSLHYETEHGNQSNNVTSNMPPDPLQYQAKATISSSNSADNLNTKVWPQFSNSAVAQQASPTRSTTSIPQFTSPSTPIMRSQQQTDTLSAAKLEEVIRDLIAHPVPFTPNPEEIPPIRLPPTVPIILSVEDSPDAATYIDRYRGTVASLGWMSEAQSFDEMIPKWLMDGIMDAKTPVRDPAKMSFVLNPHPASGLPELPNNTNRLSSNRMLRVRKLLAYVVEHAQIDPPAELVRAAIIDAEHVVSIASQNGTILNPDPACAAALSSLEGLKYWGKESASTAERAAAEKAARTIVKPERYFELCCYEKALHPKTTLATIRHLMWKSPGDVTLTYRKIP